MRRYIINFLYHLDILANQLLPGALPHETLSAHLGRFRHRRAVAAVCRMLDVVEADHCKASLERYNRVRDAQKRGD